MLSGDVPIALVGSNAPIVARLRGVDITLIGGMLNILANSMIVSPGIKRPEDLRDKKLTVSRYGSKSDYATRKILLKWGLKPDIDVTILQIPGSQPTCLAAIQTKQVHGMAAQPPVTNMAQIQFKYDSRAEDFRRRLSDDARWRHGWRTFAKSATPCENSPEPCWKASTSIKHRKSSAKSDRKIRQDR